MAKLVGTKTEQHLKDAFAGESIDFLWYFSIETIAKIKGPFGPLINWLADCLRLF